MAPILVGTLRNRLILSVIICGFSVGDWAELGEVEDLGVLIRIRNTGVPDTLDGEGIVEGVGRVLQYHTPPATLLLRMVQGPVGVALRWGWVGESTCLALAVHISVQLLLGVPARGVVLYQMALRRWHLVHTAREGGIPLVGEEDLVVLVLVVALSLVVVNELTASHLVSVDVLLALHLYLGSCYLLG